VQFVPTFTLCLFHPKLEFMFADRVDAGRRLAEVLDAYRDGNTVVLAVPRGGVVVGREVAESLGVPLDVVVPRKLGAPGEPELAIGAVAPWGERDAIIDAAAIGYLGVSDEYIRRETESQLAEIDRRLNTYRGTSDPPDVAGKDVIVVDDGIATGYTVHAAISSLRRLAPQKIVLAAPVASSEALERLSGMVDDFRVLLVPAQFLAVGHWYAVFDQTTDEEVMELLTKGR
jgi:putative phosphoribosyl transferase